MFPSFLKNVFTLMGEALYSKSTSLQQVSPVVGLESQTQSTVDTKKILSGMGNCTKAIVFLKTFLKLWKAFKRERELRKTSNPISGSC